MAISVAGAKYHVAEILSRLGVRSRKDAAEWQIGSVRNTEVFDTMNRSHLQDALQGKLAIADPVLSVFDGDNRYICELPNCHFAIVADNPDGVEAMRRERKILQVLSDRVVARIPWVLKVSTDETIELRRGVPGRTRIPDLVARLDDDDELARRVIRQLVTMFADIHSSVSPHTAIELTQGVESWPVSSTWVRERLPDVLKDQGLLAQLNEVMDLYDQVNIRKYVLCQGDPTLQNVAFSDELDVNGIYDFYTAAARDPEWDLRYLVYGPTKRHYALMDHGIDTYAELGDYQPSRERVLLYNAVSAIAYLAYRKGIDADVLWCGRTLAGDLAWTRLALSKLG